MSEVLVVFAEMKAKAGKEEETRKLLTGLLEPTRREDGCIQYDVHQSIENPRLFSFYERWVSKAHLDKHLQSAHITAAFAKAPAFLEGAPVIHLVTKIEK